MLVNPRAVVYEPKCVVIAANEVAGRHHARAQGISQVRVVVVTPANVAHKLRGMRDVDVVEAPGWSRGWTPQQIDMLTRDLAVIEAIRGRR